MLLCHSARSTPARRNFENPVSLSLTREKTLHVLLKFHNRSRALRQRKEKQAGAKKKKKIGDTRVGMRAWGAYGSKHAMKKNQGREGVAQGLK
jgi:hypothetical protein